VKNSISLGVPEDVVLTVPKGTVKNLQASMDLQKVIKAPIQAGDSFGTLQISNGEEVVREVPLVAGQAVAEGGFFKRLWDSLSLFFTNLFSGDTLSV
jgi:D-alanyl-D-alanine carboxypeptidase (penicillin-binding protein 5/6)